VTTARFFVNGVDTTTKGVDIVARYRLDADEAGRFDLTLAANFNDTNVKVPTTSTLSSCPFPRPCSPGSTSDLRGRHARPEVRGSKATGATARGAPPCGRLYGNGAGAQRHPGAGLQAPAPHVGTWKPATRFGQDRPPGPWGEQPVRRVSEPGPGEPVNTTGVVAFPSFSPFGFNGRFLYTRLSLQLVVSDGLKVCKRGAESDLRALFASVSEADHLDPREHTQNIPVHLERATI
jgi:iron complex outermembrane receptor protein